MKFVSNWYNVVGYVSLIYSTILKLCLVKYKLHVT